MIHETEQFYIKVLTNWQETKSSSLTWSFKNGIHRQHLEIPSFLLQPQDRSEHWIKFDLICNGSLKSASKARQTSPILAVPT